MLVQESIRLNSGTQQETLHPELQECIKQNQETKERIKLMLSDLTLEQFNWSPTPGRWTIAQNIHHLSLECREQLPLVERLIEKGWEQQIFGSGTFRHPWFGNFYCRFLEPPYRSKIPTLKRFTAPPHMEFDEVVPEFMRHKAKIFELIQSANGLHLSKLRARVTYSKVKSTNWTLSLGQWLKFFAIHERRHLWQIEQFVQGDSHYPK
jgi:hypothetical protein